MFGRKKEKRQDLPAPEQPVNLAWEPRTESDDFLSLEFAAKSWAKYGLPTVIVLSLLAVVSAFKLVSLATHLPKLQGFAGGSLYKGEIQRQSDLTYEDFYPQFRDTTKYLFYRTEKGILPEIKDFVAADIFSGASRDYTNIKQRYPGGFVQTLQITDERHITSNETPMFRQVNYACILASRSVTGSQTSVIYLAAGFQLQEPSGINASGWRMINIMKIRADQFYAEERAAEERKRLGLTNSPDKQNQPAQPSPSP